MAKKQTKRTAKLKQKLRLLVVPHRKNQYRPHLVRRYGIAVVLIVVLALQMGVQYVQTGSVLGRLTTVTPNGLLASTNSERANEGAGELTLNTELTEAATQKAHDMVANNYWSHESPAGAEPWDWIDNTSYVYREAGENLAKNFTTSDAAVTAWMASSEHRENMLKPSFQDVGFAVEEGVIDGKDTTVIVALYGAPAGDAQVAAATTDVPNTAPSLTLADRIGIALQSLTPAAVTGIALLFIAATVSITAHVYRTKLPKKQRESWYRHHGAFKATGLLTFAAFIVLLYGGGQIL